MGNGPGNRAFLFARLQSLGIGCAVACQFESGCLQSSRAARSCRGGVRQRFTAPGDNERSCLKQWRGRGILQFGRPYVGQPSV